MREFYIEDLNKALAGREYGLSIRQIAKDLRVPKSSVGRWVQDPNYYRQSMQFKGISKDMRNNPDRMVKRDTKRGPRSDYDKFTSFKEKILKDPIGRQRDLHVTYDDGTGKWRVHS